MAFCGFSHIFIIFICLYALSYSLSVGGAGGKGVWGAAGMVYEDEEPDLRDPNYDESAQVSTADMDGSYNVYTYLKEFGFSRKPWVLCIFPFCFGGGGHCLYSLER